MPKFISDEEMSKLEFAQPAQSKKVISDDEMAKMEADKPGYIETGMRGFTQGVSAGFQDELAGAIAGLGRVAGFKDLEHGFDRAEDGATIDMDKISEAYRNARDIERGYNKDAATANPKTYLGGNVAGGVAQTLAVPGLNAAKGAGLFTTVGKGALQGSLAGAGNSEADDIGGLLTDTAIGGGMGGTFAGGAYGAGKGFEKLANARMLGEGTGYIADKLDDSAESWAVNATGATGRQSEKFADDAGRQLLDRGLVRPFDSPASIAKRVGKAEADAGRQIHNSLQQLDAKGGQISQDEIVEQLQMKINELKGDASQAPLARKLQGIVDDIVETGRSNMPLSEGEGVKRGFGSKINNWVDQEAGQANKQGYFAYRDQVEKQALALDPSLANKFKEGKETFGLLAPIEEAASRRAAQLSQSPVGGLLDTTSIIASGGNPAGPIARRIISPRIGSTMAWSADKIADAVRATPQAFGKFSTVLQQAAQRGPEGVASTHFILQQTNPEYREMVNSLGQDD